MSKRKGKIGTLIFNAESFLNFINKYHKKIVLILIEFKFPSNAFAHKLRAGEVGTFLNGEFKSSEKNIVK